MHTPASRNHPVATSIGLVIALVGMPLFIALFRRCTGENGSDAQVVVRELGLFALVGLLLWIVRSRERLPLASIGLRVDRIGKSMAWGALLAVVALGVTVGLYLLLPAIGLHIGGGDGNAFKPSLWVVALIMLRAGVAEEIFYRGYAIERLEALTRHRWIATLVPLAAFAAAHYRQGAGGIVAALVLGGLFTVAYMKRRDLLANMTGHVLADFVLNVGLPLLGGD